MAVVVSQVIVYGETMSSFARFTPSSLNCTPTTPTLSDAVAETITLVSETVAPLAGAVRETMGAIVSAVEVKVAVTVVFPVTATVQVRLVAQPLEMALAGETTQLVKAELVPAVAERVNAAPLVRVAEQVLPQLMAPPETVPAPVPVF